MIKRYDKFVKESFSNKGKGPGNQDLILSAPKKQIINRAIPTMDFLRIGKHILTPKIDGFIDSVQNENIFISDRMTGEITKYSLKEILRELTKSKEGPKNQTTVQGFEGTPVWATKQKIYESNIERSPRFPSPDIEELPEIEFGTEEEEERDEIDFDYGEDKNEVPLESTPEFRMMSQSQKNKLLYGTEDNPMGLPNKGERREMPGTNESWVNMWDNFNNKQVKLLNEYLEEDEEEEPEIVRGTEDNPLPDRKRRPKIESY